MPAVSIRTFVAGLLCLATGIALAWVDSRPSWDDSGITAGAITVVAFLAALARVSPVVAAVLVAGPIVSAEVSRGFGVMLVIPFAVGGAIAGTVLRKSAGAGHDRMGTRSE